jgi:hypothetical protein
MPQKIGFLSPLATNQADAGVIPPPGHTAEILTASEPPAKELIERALSAVDIRYGHDPDGDPYTNFRIAGKTLNLALHCWFMLVGPNHDIFKFSSQVEPLVPVENFAEALISSNEFNRVYRFGRAYLDSEEHASAPCLHLEGQVLLSAGTTQGFLEDFILSHLACFRDFLSQASMQNVFSLTRPKARRKSNGKATGKGGAEKPK